MAILVIGFILNFISTPLCLLLFYSVYLLGKKRVSSDWLTVGLCIGCYLLSTGSIIQGIFQLNHTQMQDLCMINAIYFTLAEIIQIVSIIILVWRNYGKLIKDINLSNNTAVLAMITAIVTMTMFGIAAGLDMNIIVVADTYCIYAWNSILNRFVLTPSMLIAFISLIVCYTIIFHDVRDTNHAARSPPVIKITQPSMAPRMPSRRLIPLDSIESQEVLQTRSPTAVDATGAPSTPVVTIERAQKRMAVAYTSLDVKQIHQQIQDHPSYVASSSGNTPPNASPKGSTLSGKGLGMKKDSLPTPKDRVSRKSIAIQRQSINLPDISERNVTPDQKQSTKIVSVDIGLKVTTKRDTLSTEISVRSLNDVPLTPPHNLHRRHMSAMPGKLARNSITYAMSFITGWILIFVGTIWSTFDHVPDSLSIAFIYMTYLHNIVMPLIYTISSIRVRQVLIERHPWMRRCLPQTNNVRRIAIHTRRRSSALP